MPLQLVLRDEQSLSLPLVSFSLFSGVIKVFDGTTILILKVIMFQMEIATDLVLASNFLLVGFFLFLRPKISSGWICSPSVFLCSSWPVREKPHSVGKHQASLDLTVLKSQAEISHGVYTLSPQAFQPFNISISSLPYTLSTSPTLTKASYPAYDTRGSCLCSLGFLFPPIYPQLQTREVEKDILIYLLRLTRVYTSLGPECLFETQYFINENTEV